VRRPVERLFIDTNVLLDYFLPRVPWDRDAARVFLAVQRGDAEAVVSAQALVTVHFLVRRERGRAVADEVLRSLLGRFEVAPVSGGALEVALASRAPDFEDGVQVAVAAAAGCTRVVTRDLDGFRGQGLPVSTPTELAGELT
jgi:predicted nucleic acid-binding protein